MSNFIFLQKLWIKILTIFLFLQLIHCQTHQTIEIKTINETSYSPTQKKNINRLPIVYVYTVVPAVCKYGLPDYIKHSLEQAESSQPDCDVIMAGNYAECPQIANSIINMTGIMRLDTALLKSKRTAMFLNLSTNIFELDYGGELWITSALRFFNMEDIMISQGYDEMLHVEADNLLYGSITSLLPILRTGYKGLAATPLNSNKTFITASVLWISSLKALQKFNDYLLGLASNYNNGWKNYLKWLRPYGCCKKGGIDPDKDGNGIKPYAINEMSMLAYYHHIQPNEFKLLPVVSTYNYILNRHVCNMSDFGPNGHETGPATLDGIWDPNSWGQYLGGTSRKGGRDKGFTDGTHIAGQAIRTSNCFAKMLCRPNIDNQTITDTSVCLTRPHVKCGESTWTPLYNLHVHSKHTKDFLSQSCICPTNTTIH